MLLKFYKMNGAGNDFVIIDNRDLTKNLSADTIAALCDRHRGIGADGLLAVEPAEQGADYRFRYYNADGGEAEMCGNGARCFARFTSHLSETPETPKEITFETIAGPLSANIVGADIRISMSTPKDLQMDIPEKLSELDTAVHFVNTGVPHAVLFTDHLSQLDVVQHGRAIRHHPHFAPSGTNVNFVQSLAESHIAIRTYERGVEDETLACGTGMVAAALLQHLTNGSPSPIKVDVAGGESLEIAFQKGPKNQFTDVTLTGPADFVFEGEIEI